MTLARIAPIVLLTVVAAVNILWMPAEFLAGDPHYWREEARSILLSGELHVPVRDERDFIVRGMYLVQNEGNGLYYSKYGIGNALLAVPPMLLGYALGWVDLPRGQHSLLLFNLWNVVLSLALAALLYALSATYSRRVGVRVAFVLAALYCTSLWFYQRAQSPEIYLTLFFTAFFIALLRFLHSLEARAPDGLDRRAWAWLAAAWACVAALLFTRIVFGLLLPLVVLLAVYCAARGRTWAELRPGMAKLGAALLLPPLLMVALLGLVNHVKFGAPWLTGYHQWAAEIHHPIGSLYDGLWGFLFAPRFSVFLHFPPLAFALVALPRFFARHRLDALAMLSIFLVFLLFLAKLPSWAGEWTYGPRYLLPMLPVLSLPILAFADDLLDRMRTWRARAWAATAIVVLAYSGYLQTRINLLPFFTYYYARDLLLAARPLESIEYFLNRHNALIAQDFVPHRYNIEKLPFYADMARNAPPGSFNDELSKRLAAMLRRGNLYWALPPDERGNCCAAVR